MITIITIITQDTLITISIIITMTAQDTLITMIIMIIMMITQDLLITIIMMMTQDTLGEGEFGKVVSASLNNFRGKPGDGGNGVDI